MKQLLAELADYHIWANKQIFDVILTLPVEKQKAVVPSSFKSLYETVWHVWFAENTWWQRLASPADIQPISKEYNGGFEEMVKSLHDQSHEWKNWISFVTEDGLKLPMQYKNAKGDEFSEPIYQVAMHVFNHATYHRGQLINMLRQLGVEKLPSSDFILWARRK